MAEQLIYKAISEAMEACEAVAKDSKNPQQGYKYRGIDAVMNAINPALRKAKIFAAPEVIESSREERTTSKGGLLIYSIAKVKYTFYAADGSNVSAIVVGEGMDSGDKSFNKAMSAAFKYALFQVFCIPTEEMMDSEADSPEPQKKVQKNPQELAKATAQQLSPDKTRMQIIRLFKSESEQWQKNTLENWKLEKVEDGNEAFFGRLENHYRSTGKL